MIASGILCIGSYFLISLSPYPALGLLGCGLCGLSVGIMWPGSFSMASAPYGEEGPQCSHFWLWQGTWAVPAGLPLWVLYPGFFWEQLKNRNIRGCPVPNYSGLHPDLLLQSRQKNRGFHEK